MMAGRSWPAGRSLAITGLAYILLKLTWRIDFSAETVHRKRKLTTKTDLSRGCGVTELDKHRSLPEVVLDKE